MMRFMQLLLFAWVESITARRRLNGDARHYNVLRIATGAIFSDSRYLATVRRATTMPCSPSSSAILLSESGFLGSSAETSCLMRARIAVLDAAPPESVATWLPKKYLSSKTPSGVAMNLFEVTREMVDSCKLTVSAISRNTSGRMARSEEH